MEDTYLVETRMIFSRARRWHNPGHTEPILWPLKADVSLRLTLDAMRKKTWTLVSRGKKDQRLETQLLRGQRLTLIK